MTQRAKITNGYANNLEAQDKLYIVWDTQLIGFAVRIQPSGRKTFFYKYNSIERRVRKVTIGRHGDLTADEARQVAKTYARKVAAGEDPAAERTQNRQSMTISELYDMYVERHSKQHKKPKSIENDRLLMDKHIRPKLGSYKINTLQKRDVLNLFHSMSDIPYQANRIIALLRHMFNKAEEWEIISQGQNPCVGIKKYKEKGRERFLSEEEVARLFAVLDEIDQEQSQHPSVTRAIKLLLLTGCRMNEILTLKWEYVDMRNSCFNLPDSKTGKKRVPVGKPVFDILAEIPRLNDNPHVIYGKITGEHFKDIQRQWRIIRKRAGIEDVRIHDLRHSFASFAVTQGYSLPMIAKILGHKDIATTQRYAHLAFDPVAEAAHDISGMIAGVVRH